MSYTELNAELVEKLGNLERLCNQIYNTQHGVTCYIKEMERIYSDMCCFSGNYWYYHSFVNRINEKPYSTRIYIECCRALFFIMQIIFQDMREAL